MEENKTLTTKEVAEYIKLNEKAVLNLAQYGELPGVKVGNQWNFHLCAVDQYLQKQFIESRDEDLDSIIQTKDHPIPLSRLTDHRLVDLEMTAKNKSQVLSQLARIAHRTRLTPSYDGVYIALEEREKLLSTAVGQGVAIPHVRVPHQSIFSEPHIIIARLNVGINFDAPDGQKVNLFFMPCSQNEYVHVRLMAKIAKLLHKKDVVYKLKNALKVENVLQVLKEYDQSKIFSDS